MINYWIYPTFIGLVYAVAAEVPSVAIFNQWKYENPPYLFNWEKDGDGNYMVIKSFNNTIGMQIKWSCSAELNGKMYIFGGQPDDGHIGHRQTT